jgi:hypothetical protein
MLHLPIWLRLVCVVLSGAAGLFYGRRLFTNGVTFSKQQRVRDMPLIPVGLLGFVAFLLASHLLLGHPQWGWYAPLVLEYHLMPFFWAMRLAFVCFPMAALVHLGFRLRYPNRHALALFCVVAVLGVEFSMQHATRPNLPELREKIQDGMILQSSAVTCAPASCANIVGRLGIKKTEAEMAHAMNTMWSGTSPAQVVYGLRSLGLDARKKNAFDLNLRAVTPPAVLLVKYGDEVDAHAVAYMGATEAGTFEIWNPAGGKTNWDDAVVKERWDGHAIEVALRESNGTQ